MRRSARLVEVLAHAVLEQRIVDHRLLLGDADALAEVAHRLRRVAAAADAGDGGHARVVPAGDDLLLHQAQQLPLPHHRVRQVQAGELDLARLVDAQRFDEPVVQRPVVLELQGADRVRDALERVGLAVRPVVHRIDAPLVAGAVMARMQDAVHHGVAQVDVGRRHVDLRPEHPRAVGELAGAHPHEEVEVLFDAAVAERAVLARRRPRAAVGADLLGGGVADERLARMDELHCPFEELLEVVRGVELALAPVEAEPAHVLPDRADVFVLLVRRVGVVETQVASARRARRRARS